MTSTALLLSPEFPTLIRSLNEMEHYWKEEEQTPLDLLAQKLGTKRFNVAIEWDSKLDPLYEGPEPSETELNDVFSLRETMDKADEHREKNNILKQFSKYQLIKSFQTLIDQLYPDKN